MNLGSFATAEEAALHVARSRRRGGRRRSAGGAGSSGAKAEAGIECLALTLVYLITRFSYGFKVLNTERGAHPFFNGGFILVSD